MYMYIVYIHVHVYTFMHCHCCSGKSNLMDAISFVLGEKTQHLRVRNLRVSSQCPLLTDAPWCVRERE